MLPTVTLEMPGLQIPLKQSCKSSPQHAASSDTRNREKAAVLFSGITTSGVDTLIHISSGVTIQHDKYLKLVITSAWRKAASTKTVLRQNYYHVCFKKSRKKHPLHRKKKTFQVPKRAMVIRECSFLYCQSQKKK